MVRMLFLLFVLTFSVAPLAADSWPKGVWVSEGERGQIEIYPCSAPGHEVSSASAMEKLCSYVKGDSDRLCGRIVKVLPNGEAELKAKGKTVRDELLKPMLCIAPSGDTTWPWKGGVFNPDDGDTYWLKAAPDGQNKLRGSGCGGFGYICPDKGRFVWKRAG